MTTIYFAGAENPGWRKRLLEHDVEHVAVAFKALQGRLPKKKAFSFPERYPGQKVFLDGGVSDDPEYIEAYHDFVHQHRRDIAFASEVTSRQAERHRDEFWQDLPEDKVLVVWDHTTGLRGLQSLCERFYRVGVTEEALKAVTTLRGQMMTLERRYGVKWHALGIGNADILRTTPFETVSHASWISPMRYGETQVWDGNRLHRYPASMKDQARKRHRQTFVRHGFDPGKLDVDDHEELTRLSIWSWQQLEAQLTRKVTRKRRPPTDEERQADPFLSNEVAMFEDGDDEGSTQVGLSDVATPPSEVRENERASEQHSYLPEPTPRAEHVPLPVFAVSRSATQVEDAEGNVVSERSQMSMRTNGRSLRRCDSCYVADACPAMTPGAECAFEFPLEVRTKDDLREVMNSMIEMQTQRVAFMRFVEETQGGYADPNLSGEIDRLFRITEMAKNIEDTREFARITMETRGGAGRLSRLFGANDVEPVKALPQPLDTDATDRLAHAVIDAEVLD